MCGRYYRRSDKQKIAEAFHVKQVGDFPLPPWDYNVAPQTMQPIIRANRDTGERELVQLRWGLVPFSTKSLADLKGKSTINARAEAVTKGWWAQPFKKRRCLVPASGFYEWTHDDPKNKRPFAFDLANGKPMAFAGLWDAWKNPADGSWLQTYSIITTDANELMTIHNRMPVILHEGDFNRWLDREETHQPPIDLLRPFPADEMEAFEVSKDVGNVRNNSAELLNSR
ncbi:SOS response-associated peptidase [Edaphobacter modestus]|uniref:Abasic site processing protein n=1 Tax=Edaphobacter modestus TaxID=388466 RepID=A0A4Q7YR51_9BACT|nr:SOS response-associated peptidase [Edaphobacter modestus]RZU39309.1 putative SOS response-associated peptidase YedK [Edaphobacter modestus]